MDMELEAYLRPPKYPMAPYPAKVVTHSEQRLRYPQTPLIF